MIRALAGLLLLASASAEAQSLEQFVIADLLSAKRACAIAYPEMSEPIRHGFEALVARNTRVYRREQWLELDALPVPPGPARTRDQCTKLIEELRTADVDALLLQAREEGACIEAFRAAAERSRDRRSWIGIELAREGADARIGQVLPGSPAAEAGLAPGDLVVEYASEPIASGCRLAVAVLRSAAGAPVPIVAMRGSARLRLTVTPISVRSD